MLTQNGTILMNSLASMTLPNVEEDQAHCGTYLLVTGDPRATAMNAFDFIAARHHWSFPVTGKDIGSTVQTFGERTPLYTHPSRFIPQGLNEKYRPTGYGFRVVNGVVQNRHSFFGATVIPHSLRPGRGSPELDNRFLLQVRLTECMDNILAAPWNAGLPYDIIQAQLGSRPVPRPIRGLNHSLGIDALSHIVEYGDAYVNSIAARRRGAARGVETARRNGTFMQTINQWRVDNPELAAAQYTANVVGYVARRMAEDLEGFMEEKRENGRSSSVGGQRGARQLQT